MGEQGQAVNRQIAEALGYKVERTGFANGYGAPVVGFRLISPQGHEVIDWEHYNGDLGGYSSSELAWRCAPDYEHSLDAVVAELPENYSFEVNAVSFNKYFASIREYIAGAEVSRFNVIGAWDGRGATRHEAAAKALLAFALERAK